MESTNPYTGQHITQISCEECPSRRSSKEVLFNKSYPLLQMIIDGEITTDELEVFADENANNNAGKCAGEILEGNCDRYAENPDSGYYITDLLGGDMPQVSGFNAGGCIVARTYELEGDEN